MDKKQILIGAAVLLGVYFIYKKINKPTEKGEIKGTSTTTTTTKAETIGETVVARPVLTPLSSGSNTSVATSSPAPSVSTATARMAASSADTTGGDVTQNVRSGARSAPTVSSQPLIATISPTAKLQSFAANGWGGE